MCKQCGCSAPKSSQGKNGIPAPMSVPTYDPNAKPWTSHEQSESAHEKK